MSILLSDSFCIGLDLTDLIISETLVINSELGAGLDSNVLQDAGPVDLVLGFSDDRFD